ncbi:MAG TPA: IreB family regulatory phosphoprotein [Lachnospiraceae bacterium]|nr:IreB family regulatory phosphoprotein [Lachnospiraceae bacterium]
MNSNEDRGGTQYFRIVNQPENSVASVLADVYRSLQKKGYNPVNQLVGYIMSEDPTYITSYNNSRGKIARLSQDEIIEELVRSFVEYYNLEQDEPSDDQ